MLVLSRKTGEKIVLPASEVTITVTAINNNRVCLGISAPSHVQILREEVWTRVSAERQLQEVSE